MEESLESKAHRSGGGRHTEAHGKVTLILTMRQMDLLDLLRIELRQKRDWIAPRSELISCLIEAALKSKFLTTGKSAFAQQLREQLLAPKGKKGVD